LLSKTKAIFMKIIVTGSLGNISKPLTNTLIKKGHQVAVISSNVNRQNDIEALGAVAAIGSVDDIGFLTAAFTGADAVYAMVPPNDEVPDMIPYYEHIGSNYAEAIRQSGVKRVVYLSSYGAHLTEGTGIILGAHKAEVMLNQLHGVAITHLRPTYFYYNLLNFIGMIKEQGFIGANYGGEDKLAMVAPADIATVAAEELETMPAIGTHVRYISSDDLTASDTARILGEAIGKPDLQWLTFTNEQVLDNFVKMGMPPLIAANYVDLGASTHNGALREEYDQQKPSMKGTIKLKDFAKEFAAAYQSH
jgi:uncharacterized protein YbjT (DUF2867 family)